MNQAAEQQRESKSATHARRAPPRPRSSRVGPEEQQQPVMELTKIGDLFVISTTGTVQYRYEIYS